MLKWFLKKNVVLDLITTNSTTPKFNLLLPSFSFRYYCTTTTTTTSQSDTNPLPISALKDSNQNQVSFKSPNKPKTVIPNIDIIIKKRPWLLSSVPHKRLLPKFQFFLSKGVSSCDIISLLKENPRILHFSLGKRIIPLFELLSRFLKTNKDVIVCLIRHSSSFARTPYDLIVANINLMTDFGVCDSNIARLLQQRPSIFGSTDLIKSLEEVKGLGFDPSMTTFEAALSKKLWDEKVDTFKKWGWSDEDIDNVFRRQPNLLFASLDKINLLMNFWINQLGWDSVRLRKCPFMFNYNVHIRIIPRASVLQYLLMKGLREKNASLITPFIHSEKLFLSKFVYSFKEEESDYLSKLYKDKMKLAYTKKKKNNGKRFSK
jgi:mTERF domain-containing protein